MGHVRAGWGRIRSRAGPDHGRALQYCTIQGRAVNSRAGQDQERGRALQGSTERKQKRAGGPQQRQEDIESRSFTGSHP